MGNKTTKPMNKGTKFTIIVACEVVFLLALVVCAVATGSWFQSSQNLSEYVTLGDLAVVWCDNTGEEYVDKSFTISDNVSGGSVFYKDMYITNTGTNEAYLRTKIELFYEDVESGDWIRAALPITPNQDPTKWVATSDGFFYYNAMNQDEEIEDPKFGCIYSNEVVLFATVFTFDDPLSDLLLNKNIKVVFTCETIQSNVDEALNDWGDNIPSDWLDNIGVVPPIYMFSTTTSRDAEGLVSFDLSAAILNQVTLTTKNKGSKQCYIKVDPKVVVSNPLFPSGYIEFTTTSAFTKSTNDGKFYYNSVVRANSAEISLILQPVLNNIENFSTEGLTYTIEFYIESLEYDNSITLAHSFFDNAPTSWTLPRP